MVERAVFRTAGSWHGLAVFGAVMATYYWSAPRAVVLEDDGLFIVSAYFNAIAHSPGYPLYTALAHVATLVPVGSVAMRVHMLSALFGALACVAIFHIALRLFESRWYACATALVFGFSLTFWSQSIIAEVYTLNVLLFFLLVLPALGVAPTESTRNDWGALGIGLLFGLALSNHWPLTLLSAPALAVLYWRRRKWILWHAVPVALGIAAGLIPYLWLIYRTHVVPEFCVIGPIRSWHEFWFYVSREGFREVDIDPGAGWTDRLRFAGFALGETARQFGPAGVLFTCLGFWRQWREWPARVCWGLVAAFAGSTFALIMLLQFDYDLFHRNVFRVYPLVAYGCAALWTAFGVQYLARWLTPRTGARWLHAGLVVLLVGTTWMQNARANYRVGDEWALKFGTALLDSLPRSVALYANASTVNGPARYLHFVEGMRPDLALTSGSYLPFGGEIHRPYQLPRAALESLLEQFARDRSRPVYYTNEFPHPFGYEDYGLYMKVRPDLPREQALSTAHPAIMAYLESLARLPPPNDPWERMHYWRLRTDHCRLWANLNAAALVDRIRSRTYPACDHFTGRLLMVSLLLAADIREPELMLAVLGEAALSLEEAETKKQNARLAYLSGEVMLKSGRRAEAVARFEDSLAAWRDPRNPAASRLDQIRSED
ncbi:MAG: DUF2723 domain-containing protein [Gammaproteobacteria bacterium]|nr:DUF2723 domain-containing protein [Gammaproteobacteria bacterium]